MHEASTNLGDIVGDVDGLDVLGRVEGDRLGADGGDLPPREAPPVGGAERTSGSACVQASAASGGESKGRGGEQRHGRRRGEVSGGGLAN